MDKEDRFRQSTWVEFLHRRLTRARDLLAKNGVPLVSIDHDQRALLELTMDEVLPGMKVGSLVWRTRVGGDTGRDHFFTVNHKSVLALARPSFWFRGSEKSFEKCRCSDEERQEQYRVAGNDDGAKAAPSARLPKTIQCQFQCPIRDRKAALSRSRQIIRRTQGALHQDQSHF